MFFMSDRIQISHYYTTGTTAPAAENLALGEIAVSTNANNEKLFIKNNNENIVSFSSDGQIAKKFIHSTGGTVNGALTVNGNLNITGVTNLNSLSIGNTATFNNPITLQRTATAVTLNTNVTVNGSSILTIQPNIQVNGNSSYNGNVTYNGVVAYDGAVDFNNSVSFSEDATFGNGVTVNDSNITVSNGNVTSSGGFYDTSDERVKNFRENIKVDLDKLSSLKKAYFQFNDNRDDNLLHIGVSAQEIKELYPEIVRENEIGMLTVDYSKLSVIALEAVDVLYKKNKKLEERLNKIEQILGC
jgi:hypothetical protein